MYVEPKLTHPARIYGTATMGYCVPGTMPGAEAVMLNKTDQISAALGKDKKQASEVRKNSDIEHYKKFEVGSFDREQIAVSSALTIKEDPLTGGDS